MDFVDAVYSYVLDKCKWHMETSEDHYDFWNEHIKYVYEEANWLAERYDADSEIVKLGALLHDIALICMVGTRAEHHINGRKMAEEILTKFNYPKDRMTRVLDCIYHHRSSKDATNLEEMCVADADILAHFDNIPMLFDLLFNVKKMSLEEVHKEMPTYLEKDYDDLSERTKLEFEEKYEKIKEILIIK